MWKMICYRLVHGANLVYWNYQPIIAEYSRAHAVFLQELETNQGVVPSPRTVRHLGLHYSGIFNFSEYTLIRVANPGRLIGLVHSTFITLKSKLLIYKMHFWSIVNHYFFVFQHATKWQAADWAFTKWFLGYSSLLNYIERCTKLHLYPL